MKNLHNLQNLQQKIWSVIFCVTLLSLFSGCSAVEEQQSEFDLKSIVETVQERSAYFTLERTADNMVSLFLHNPKKKIFSLFLQKLFFHLIY